ncbi:MAG TPA: FAD-dependent oxidoreductase, partial [Spongiibacteraceae bacterium]|nr:FAD-dependent oxidoreductase [Spongiibacteraceae bacterium]
RLGGNWHCGAEVQALRGGGLRVNGEWLNAGQVIDCRGTGAKPDAPRLRGVRGEVLWVQAPEVQLSRPVRLMHPRYQLYISPRPDHIYVIGATEIESESTAPITVRSSLELQSALYSLHRGFSEAHILKAYAQCRPAYPDNLPRIDSEPGLLRVNGLYRHGYLLSPLVAELALQSLHGPVDHSIVRRPVAA